MDPLVSSLTLEAFRGIQNLKLEGLAPVTLIVGANNSGKTSVLEAAGLILRPFDPGQWVQTARQRDFSLELVDGIWSLFPGGAAPNYDEGPPTSAQLRISAELAGAKAKESRRLEAEATTTLEYNADGKEEEFLQVRASVDGAKHTMAFRRTQKAELIKAKYLYRVFAVTPASHRQVSLLYEHLGHAVQIGKKQLAIQILQLFDPQVQDLDGIDNYGRRTVFVTHAERGVVDLSSFGDGMRQAAALALTLARVNAGVLLVDEIESGIHAFALEEMLTMLFQAAAEAEVQIIATTHSLEAVDAAIHAVAKIGSDCGLAGFYVQKRETKHFCQRFDSRELADFRAGGRDIR